MKPHGMIDSLRNEKRIIVDQLILIQRKNEIDKLLFDFIENIGSIKQIFYIFIYYSMSTKEKTTKKNIKKSEKVDKKLILQKWDEITKWKLANANQKWFFSLEQKEQDFIESMFIIVVQMCPELTWENFIDRLRKADRVKVWEKAIIKKLIWEL